MSINFEKALKQLNEKSFSEALDSFTTLLKQDPNDVRFLSCRAICYRNTDQLELSIADLTKAIQLQNNNADLYSERGVSQLHLKQPELALTDFVKAKELEPKNAYRYSSIAFVYSRMRNAELAIEFYEKAIELDPEDAVSYNNLAVLHEQKGNIDKYKSLGKKADELAGNMVKDIPEKDAPQQSTKKEIPQPSQEAVKITPDTEEKRSYWKVIKSVFKDEKEFKNFIQFIKNGFKLK